MNLIKHRKIPSGQNRSETGSKSVSSTFPIAVGMENSESRRSAISGYNHKFNNMAVHPASGHGLQTKFSINEYAGKSERQADAMADHIMQMPGIGSRNLTHRSIENQGRNSSNLRSVPANSSPKFSAGRGGLVASNDIQRKIATANSAGSRMDEETQSSMSHHFHSDFSGVTIHTNSEAIQMNKDLNARAFTIGPDIYFNSGEYNPGTPGGKHLLAHELTHVVQQDARSQSVIQRKPARDPVHDSILDAYSDYSGIPRDVVSIADPAYESWLMMSGNLRRELTALVDNATWPQIRKRVYPLESAAGIQRAKDRHAKKLPDLTGLGRLASLDRFAASIHDLQNRWTAIASPDDKVKAIGKAADDELRAADVPPFMIVKKEPMGFKGYFSGAEWKYAISEELVKGAALTTDDAAEVANTTLHESRHAEQAFLAARFSAGVNNLDAAGIVGEQNIPDAIAKVAVAKKFDSGTDASVKALGKQMYQADVTDKRANQAISNDDGWNDLEVFRKAGQTALLKLQNGATKQAVNNAQNAIDALKAQIKVVEQKYALYRRIPYEADAHEVGDAAEEAFRGWPPIPASTP